MNIILNLLEQWQRNWRIAESRLLFLALVVSVTAVSSVTFFTDRTDQAMQRQASKIMGGDLVLQSPRPIAKSYLQQAQLLGIRSAQITSFPSMILVNDKSQLVQVKAASSTYPLFGELSIANGLDAQGQTAAFDALPSAQAWAAPHLFVALGIKPGTTVQLGKRDIELSGVISKSPDQGAAAFEFMPQLLMPLADLPATGLLTPASRAKFSLFFAGKPTQIAKLRSWLTPRLQRAEKIRSLDDGLPSVQQALKRGQKFLSLASLLSVILAGVAIALTSYSLSQRETHTVAILKTIGASRKYILKRYAMQLFLLATIAAGAGILLGFVFQYALAFLLRDLIGEILPAPSFLPVLSGLLTAWIMVLGFSLPQLIRLIDISPVSIFQKTEIKITKNIVVPVVAIALGMLVLIWLQVHEVALSILLLLGLMVILACFWLVSLLLLKLLHWANQTMRKRILPLPKANFRIALLIMVFGIGFFSLLLLTSLRTDLIDRWQATLPDDAPNYFLINIQPNEVEPINQYLQQHAMASKSSSKPLSKPSSIYPMIRGRLTQINNKTITLEDFDSRRAKGLLDREANISTTSRLPEGNTISLGQWFKPAASEGLSIEEGIGKVLKLKLGDTLTFDIAGQAFTQPITSFRTVRWDSMQPNFFILAAPQALQDKPKTFMTSIYVKQHHQQFIPALVKQYPSVSAIDIGTILSKIKELINKAAFAVQTLFVFTLLSGIAVLFSALQSQKAERRKEIAILKSMGASHSYLRRNIITEFVLIGAIAGFMAAVFAMLVSNLLAYRLFDLTPAINPYLLIIGVIAGALLVGVGGYMNLRGLFQVAPRALFQE
ncbi:MAG: FtsX-like permease family protein [Thiotrichaceae bacterium]